MAAKRKRSTHSDLATLLEDVAGKLEQIGRGAGAIQCVTDASTLRLLRDAATILCEQDEQIDNLTTAIREHRDGRQFIGRLNRESAKC